MNKQQRSRKSPSLMIMMRHAGAAFTILAVAATVMMTTTAAFQIPSNRNNAMAPPMHAISPSPLLSSRDHASFSMRQSSQLTIMGMAKSKDDDEDNSDDDDSDDKFDDSVWEALASISKTNDADVMDDAVKLGIDIGSELGPLSDEDAADLKEKARKVINEAVSAGLDDIERTRDKMKREAKKTKEAMDFASELEAKRMQKELQAKIDKMTDSFLDKTSGMRASTKQAAAASRSMEDLDRGLELGTWGTLSGRTVLADNSLVDGTSPSLLGSIENAIKEQQGDSSSASGTATSSSELGLDGSVSVVYENRIVIVADVKQDPMAKQLVPMLERNFAKISKIPNLKIDIVAPTANMPIGANNADCVIVFCTSISQPSSLKQIFDKLLRKTLGTSGTMGKPPTQLVGITSAGTERTDKFPYSMQNLMGGKLDQRRQVEEVLINTVKKRVVEPPLDFTLIKFGEVKDGDASGKPFELRPGDVLDGPITSATAEQVIIQAVAFQPTARNATLSAAGEVPVSMAATAEDDADAKLAQSQFWADTFVSLEGPELWRVELDEYAVDLYDQLSEYIREWATLLEETGKGLTTPIQAIDSVPAQQSATVVKQQSGAQLLFLPTATGRNYMSKDEERQQESNKSGASSKSSSSASTKATAAVSSRRFAKEGGITVLVERTRDDALRVRARRCNYVKDAIIKELSEETILKRLEDAMEVWKKDNA